MAVLSAFSSAFRSISASKAKITAVALANEKMEIVKNLPYDLVGTSAPGIVPSVQTEQRNGLSFNVTSIIGFYNDPADDKDGVDDQPIDYKRVQIIVTKTSSSIILAKLVTDIASNAAETQTDTGIIRICIHDADNMVVEGAMVTVTYVKADQGGGHNDEVIEVITTDAVVDPLTGCIILTGLAPSQGANYYRIEVEGPDGSYSTAQTYSRTPGNPNEPFPDLDVEIQRVTDTDFDIDIKNNLTIRAIDVATGNRIPGLNIRMYDLLKWFNPPTYRYDQNFTLDNNGEVTIEGLASATYTVSILTAGWAESFSTPGNPIYLPPGDGSPPTNGAVLELHLTNEATAPRIDKVTPRRARKSSSPVRITIDGANFIANSEFKLIQGATVISATDLQVSLDGQTMAGQFNIATAPIGKWDVYVKNLATGQEARKAEGFEITN